MYILTQNSLHQPYKAKVVSHEPLQDWMFKVSYYDDEGQLTTEIVDHKRIELDEYILPT